MRRSIEDMKDRLRWLNERLEEISGPTVNLRISRRPG
jgi:hypothetical protein